MSSTCCICEARITDFTDNEGQPTPVETGSIVLIVGGSFYEFCARCADDPTVVETPKGAASPRQVFLEAKAKREADAAHS